jgi:hypothetical protein
LRVFESRVVRRKNVPKKKNKYEEGVKTAHGETL